MNKIVQFFVHKKAGLRLRLLRLCLKINGNTRPTSYPVVTGDSFRALAQHIHDETSGIHPGAVSTGDIVFVSQSMALNYLQEIHPNIIAPYILIIHNGDYTIDHRYTNLFDKNIIHCYAQNVSTVHEKLTPLPIGLSNFYNFEHTENAYRVAPLPVSKQDYQRKNKIFYRFYNGSCPSVRVPLGLFCQTHPLMETSKVRLSAPEFSTMLKKYKFLISPRGNAIDTHRPFEAFHLGLIPIVIENATVRSLQETGLPFWVIKDWEDLRSVTEEYLENKYHELMSKADFKAMHMDYWIEDIERRRKEFCH